MQNVGEVIHLFETMRRYGVKCHVSINSGGLFVGASGCVENVEIKHDGNTLAVFVGEDMGFAFVCPYHREASTEITDNSIRISVDSRDYSVTFDSGIMPDEVIEMAKLYDDTTDQVGDVKLKITSSEPHASTIYLEKLLLGGRVIKDTQVLSHGEQVLTVGYVD